MKDLSFENVVIAIGIGVFGAIVHLANKFLEVQRAAKKMQLLDATALCVTSLFSGLVFGLLAILLGEVLKIEITATQLWLSIAVGAVMGWDGLIKVANRGTDLILFAFKK